MRTKPCRGPVGRQVHAHGDADAAYIATTRRRKLTFVRPFDVGQPCNESLLFHLCDELMG